MAFHSMPLAIHEKVEFVLYWHKECGSCPKWENLTGSEIQSYMMRTFYCMNMNGMISFTNQCAAILEFSSDFIHLIWCTRDA